MPKSTHDYMNKAKKGIDKNTPISSSSRLHESYEVGLKKKIAIHESMEHEPFTGLGKCIITVVNSGENASNSQCSGDSGDEQSHRRRETHENSEGDEYIEVNPYMEKEKLSNSVVKIKDVWDTPETNYLLEKYDEYLPQIGLLNVFNTKKEMWKVIAEDINSHFSLNKTGIQCENRYKTIFRRRQNCKKLNRIYEFKKLIAIDDSLEPGQCSGESEDEQSHEKRETHENSEGEEYIEVNPFIEKEELSNSVVKIKDVWGPPETNYLLEKYDKYLPQIGLLNKFNTKKEMWKVIAEDINRHFSSNKTGIQCENRYKTIFRRRLNCSKLNSIYEVEFKNLIDIGDSLEPGQYTGDLADKQSHLKSINKRKLDVEKTRKKVALVKMLLELKKQEENRERRHREKMQMMKKLMLLLRKK